MQLQRRYNLPNCTLLLDGLADTTGEVGYSQRLGVLMNLDCYLSGESEPLSGGIDFLMGLMNAVSHYAQQFLSGISHPQTQMAPAPIQIHTLATDQHELQVYGGAEPTNSQVPQRRIVLNTVQLFDLVEALDQLLADPLTLPQLTLPLSPLSRHDAAARQPLVQRAAAPTIGLASLATAATLFFLAPVPDIQRPLVDPVPGQDSTAEPNKTPETTPSGEPTGEPQSNGSTYTREALVALNAKIYEQIDQAWTVAPDFEENMTYRVSVNTEGQIRGYRPDNDRSARYEDNTPLPGLLAVAPEGAQEELTDFKVVLTPQGRVEVNPWHGFPPEPIVTPSAVEPKTTSPSASPSTSPNITSPDATTAPQSSGSTAIPTSPTATTASQSNPAEPITDPNTLKDLNEKLYKQLDDKWVNSPTFDAPVVFRFRVDEAGQVLTFEPASSNAAQYLTELGFADLKTSNPQPAAGQAEFRAVFTPKGVVEVSPWDGF
jgi:hypothetical protein